MDLIKRLNNSYQTSIFVYILVCIVITETANIVGGDVMNDGQHVLCILALKCLLRLNLSASGWLLSHHQPTTTSIYFCLPNIEYTWSRE